MSGSIAKIIMINDRYFYGYSSRGAVLTAWSLAGAKMYGSDSKELCDERLKLSSKGKEFEVLSVGVCCE